MLYYIRFNDSFDVFLVALHFLTHTLCPISMDIVLY